MSGPYSTAKLLLDSNGSPIIMSGSDHDEDIALVSAKSNPLTGGIEITAQDGQSIARLSTQPLYVELMVTHGKSGYGTPSGLTNYPSKLGGAGAYEVTGVTVTGGKGATTLTINSGVVADLAGTWSGVILHDDGIYRTYTIRSATGTTCVCSPPLEAAASAAPLTNVQDVPVGQHLTEAGSFALADTIYRSNAAFCVRDKFIGQIKETDASGWTLYNGQAAGRVVYNLASNVHIDTPGLAHLVSRNKTVTGLSTNVNAGLQKVWAISGKVGYLETYVSCTDLVYPAIVDVYIDGYLQFREFVTSIKRVIVPFGGADTLEVRITGAGAQTGTTRIGTTTLWELPVAIQSTLFKDGDRVGWAGDSWTSRCASAVIRRLNSLGFDRGQQFIGIGMPGQQATWIIANWQKVIAANLDVLVIEYFVNDYNSLGASGLQTWLDRLNAIVVLCKAEGIRPVILMPASTGSMSQTQELAAWAAKMAEGILSE